MKKFLFILICLSLVANVSFAKSGNDTLNNNSDNRIAYANSKQNSKNEFAEKQKFEKAQKATIPYSLEIMEAVVNIENEIDTLTEKQKFGLNVSNELEILKYKYTKLNALDSQYEAFEKAYNGLSKGILTQEEYNKLRAEIQTKDYALKSEYNKIMDATAATVKEEMKKMQKQAKSTENKARKLQLGKTLINEGTYYVNPSAGYWLRRGINTFDMLK